MEMQEGRIESTCWKQQYNTLLAAWNDASSSVGTLFAGHEGHFHTFLWTKTQDTAIEMHR